VVQVGVYMPSFHRRADKLLRNAVKQPVPLSGQLSRFDPRDSSLALTPLSVVPELEVAVVPFSSPDYQQARLLQVERYSRACKPGEATYQKYQEIVDAASQQSIPLVVRRRGMSLPESLIGTARLELPSATTFETIMRFQPESQAAATIARHTHAEVGVFATRVDLTWWEVVDVMDTVASAVVALAQEYGLESLWIFPRLPMMSLLLATIPGLLPPYRFALCTDVVGWNETSDTLQKIRALGMKELPVSPETLPVVISITPEQWAEDLKQRLALQEQRRQNQDFSHLLRRAMRQAHQQMEEQVAQFHKQMGMEKNAMLRSAKKEPEFVSPPAPTGNVPPESIPTASETESAPAEAPADSAQKQGFLPFAAAGQGEAAYLRQVVEQGGDAATSYKTLSYDLLHLHPGMQVLDLGCGIGVDLPALADRVGSSGLVIGLDHDAALLQIAREANASRSNVRLVVAEALHLPFPNRSFDGVRADRVFQYISESGQALAEAVRVLRAGGTVTLVEPDWRSIALYPASPAGGDDDHTWSAIVQLCQRRLAHALIGRQLAALLHQQGKGVWEEVRAQVIAYTFSSWEVTNALLQISNLAQALIQEEPTYEEEVNSWLHAMEAAAERGEFLACVPLFFASARKAENT
jgi:SAM-dependent methyltransferase